VTQKLLLLAEIFAHAMRVRGNGFFQRLKNCEIYAVLYGYWTSDELP
jgi:hypothetical protein